jgi:hypothetical protein
MRLRSSHFFVAVSKWYNMESIGLVWGLVGYRALFHLLTGV